MLGYRIPTQKPIDAIKGPSDYDIDKISVITKSPRIKRIPEGVSGTEKSAE